MIEDRIAALESAVVANVKRHACQAWRVLFSKKNIDKNSFSEIYIMFYIQLYEAAQA
jgi:hypothetical protein